MSEKLCHTRKTLVYLFTSCHVAASSAQIYIYIFLQILKNPKDRKTMSSAHQPSPSHFSYNHDGNLHNPYLQSSWLMHPGVHNQTQDFSHMLPSRHSHAFQLHHLASMPSYSHPWPRQNVPDPASLQPDYPGLWTAGAARIPPVSAAQLYMTESPADRWMSRGEAEEAEVSSTASSKTGTNANRSPHLSQELDTKPGGTIQCVIFFFFL